ncbi:FixH family protein [Halobacillus karajensis]|uniref:Bacterial Ig-like domain (Group 1) n=1 Tax=Halobacillus karajensis TaxID=195088 RepID=A0A024P5P7_9BACI|nr:FixH family protein [Halobacillus karajensis]CDQ20433.1 Bacterial Ig-like domain (group 1) [Halobacillus karajensis]CDQ24098.1 Bacterial Ig-like domain (group 1) [Halobacillus karajensis]CDQ27576.1 Bacterial Ig-like domain (group 1) [Halobacillus karajensis]
MKNVFIVVVLLFISACSTSNTEDHSSTADDQNAAAELPEAKVDFEHEPIPANEKTPIKATVTQGGEPVPDAEYVKFEIWHDSDGQDASKTIKAEHEEDGVYQIMHTFKKEGTYQVIAHTQVDDLHVMPHHEITVGEQAEASGHDHGNNSGKFMVHLMEEQTFQAGNESTLTTHINHMEEPFSNGQVRFEISSDQSDKHTYVEAEEEELGEYTATYTFPEPGSYTINIHYEKPEEEIHEHKKETIDVVQ